MNPDLSHASPAEQRGRQALAALEGAREARSDPETADRAVRLALETAPDEFDVRLGAYRFYYYSHRWAEAAPHAEFIVEHAARRLNIATDWRAVSAQDAPFGEIETAPGLYLQALLAWGYCRLRAGAWDEAREMVAKVAALDARDRFGARALLELIERGSEQDEDG